MTEDQATEIIRLLRIQAVQLAAIAGVAVLGPPDDADKVATLEVLEQTQRDTTGKLRSKEDSHDRTD